MAEKSKISTREEATLKWWHEHQIFKKSLEKDAPNGDFVFYDGPPFATGLPHVGHILAGTMKDVIPRYKTMRGYRVPRRWGWDCHGLPVENLVEKELNLATKKEIEKFGIDQFNEKARASVLRYEQEWQEIIPRTGRWIDMDHAYKTMDANYTESVWWSFKTLFDKELIYQGFKSMHLCPRCETTLSNFEVSQGYKDITDISVYAKFQLLEEVVSSEVERVSPSTSSGQAKTYVLAWTTTPWTLPGNVALAVKSDGEYVKAKLKNSEENYILLKNLVEKVLKTDYEILEEFSGEKLVGREYKTLFDYYAKTGKVYGADFVSTEEGTGIVHIAPAFGEEDYQLSLQERLPFVQHVGTDGRFKAEVTDFAGESVKPKDDHQATDIKIIKYLAGKNLLFAKEKIVHSYPHCWRCDTPLLNYASSSWFLKVTDENLKAKIIAENQKVAWTPAEIRDGRFGKWLEGARDWAISRSRYWGATLPVWVCEKCEEQKVVGSVEELKNLLPKSGNKYFLMRHGEGDHNVQDIVSSSPDNPHHLTENGKVQSVEAAKSLENASVNLIFSSDFIRTMETAEIMAEKLGLSKDEIIYDKRLREVNFGDLNNKPFADYTAYVGRLDDKFNTPIGGGESFEMVRSRAREVMEECEKKYNGKNILIITHEAVIRFIEGFAQALDTKASWEGRSPTKDKTRQIKPGQIIETNFARYPRDNNGVLDLHRPYIDAVKLKCQKCEGEMKRVPEVFDTWYDSGSVPFASQNLRELIPADFIAEGLDQTRGWFYTLLVLSTALFGESPYKQVVVNGLILAEDGKKMSKRLQNYPELTDVLDKYGADALRYYLMASPAVRAEDVAFSEKGLDEVVKKIILRLENVVAFYELYQDENKNNSEIEKSEKNSENILDKWIFARLAQLNTEVTENLENYELDQATRPFALFVDDLSTWYLRRSRKRPEALVVLRKVLLELAKLLAPFMPFIAEDIYQKFRENSDPESVHLENWLETEKFDEKILVEMIEVRKLVSLGLELRAKEGIKIRQPLALVKLKTPLKLDEYFELIMDELNVETFRVDDGFLVEVELDTNITPELKTKGEFRDLIRAVQDERKKLKLVPGQIASLTLNPAKQVLVEKNDNRTELQKTCSLISINFSEECPTDSIRLKV